jgi:hypothetical protein
VIVAVEADLGQRRLVNVAGAERPGAARNEIRDTTLRLDALVELLMARKSDRHAVPEQQRLERGAKPPRRALVASGRVNRPMKNRDLPL